MNMNMMVVIPFEQYSSCISRCAPDTAEYNLLKNGFVVRDEDGNEEVQIPCDGSSADLIMAFAASECPEILQHIKKVMQ